MDDTLVISAVLRRYGFELMQDGERLRNLVEHRCQKQQQPLPPEESWLPVLERWLLGWPVRGSSTFIDRYRLLRIGMIRALGGSGLDSWLEQLPAITVMASPRAEVEVGRSPGSQPDLVEGLARLGWGGRLVLDQHEQKLPAPLPESELHIVGGADDATPVDMAKARWSQGWLRLENLALQGNLEVAGGLVELQRCSLQPGSSLQVTGAGAILLLNDSDIYGQLEAQACTLVQADNSTFEGARVGLHSQGLVRLQGVAFSEHAQAAVHLQARARAWLEDCQLRESGLGLQAGDHAQAWLTDCWLRDNSHCGLIAEGDSDIDVQSSQFRYNRGDGLLLRGRARVQLHNCTIQENGGAGVHCSDQVTLERSSNNVSNNPRGDWLETRA